MVFQNLFTVEEALAYLARETGLAWSENQFFESVSRYGVTMRAVASKDAVTIIRELRFPPADVCDPMPEKIRLSPGRDLLAVVHPYRVAECWLRGETSTSHPAGYDEVEGELRMFAEPVRVVRADLRITFNELNKLIKKAQRLVVLLGEKVAPKQSNPPRDDNWSKGLKLVAWEVASSILGAGQALTGAALWKGMESHKDVKFNIKADQLEYQPSSNGSLKRGELSATYKTILGWRQTLENLLKTP